MALPAACRNTWWPSAHPRFEALASAVRSHVHTKENLLSVRQLPGSCRGAVGAVDLTFVPEAAVSRTPKTVRLTKPR